MLMTASDVMTDVGSVSRVAYWMNSLGMWRSWTTIGMDFSLMPGEGYLLALTAANPTYMPSVKMF
jgi:hypothetical protein